MKEGCVRIIAEEINLEKRVSECQPREQRSSVIQGVQPAPTIMKLLSTVIG